MSRESISSLLGFGMGLSIGMSSLMLCKITKPLLTVPNLKVVSKAGIGIASSIVVFKGIINMINDIPHKKIE